MMRIISRLSRKSLLSMVTMGLVFYYVIVLFTVWDALAVLIHLGFPVPDWYIFSTEGHSISGHIVGVAIGSLLIWTTGVQPLKLLVEPLTKQGERDEKS